MNEAIIKLLADTAQYEKAMAQVEATAGRVSGALGAIGITVGVGAFSQFIASSIEAAANLHDMSMQTGMTVEDLSALRDIAEMNGVSLETLASANGKMIKAMAEARKEGSDQAAVFKALGVGVTDTSGKLLGSRETMVAVAKSIAEIESPTERAAAAQDVFGKSGAALIPMLLDLAEQGDLVATITADQVAQADTFSDALTAMRQGVRNSGQSLVMDLLPALAWVSDVVQGSIVGVQLFGRALAMVAKDVETAVKVIAAGVGSGFTEEGQNYIKEVIDERNRFMEAGTEDLDTVSQRYKSILDQVVNPPEKAVGKGGRSYSSHLSDENKKIAKEVDELARLLDKINGKDSGLDASYWKDLETLHKAYAAGRLGVEAYRDAVGKLTSQQKFHQDALKADIEAAAAHNKAMDEFFDAEEKVRQLNEDNIGAWRKKAEEIEFETSILGLSNEERERAIILHELEAKKVDLTAEEYAKLRQRLDEALGARASARAGLEQQISLWQGIEKTAHDTFISIFDSGKSAFDRLRDTLKNGLYELLYQMTLKKWIVNIGASVSGAGVASQAFGASAGGGVDLLSAGSSIGNLFSGASMIAPGSLYSSFAMSGIGQSLGLSTSSALYGGAQGLTGLGAGLGSAIPWIGGALAIGSMMGLFEGDGDAMRTSNYTGKFGASANGDYNYPQNHWFSADMWPAQQAFDKELQTFEEGLITSLKLSNEQIDKINAAITAGAGKQYEFGMEHTGTAASPQIMLDRMLYVIDALDAKWAPIIRAVASTDAKAALGQAASFMSLDAYGGADPFADYAAAAEAASRTLMATWYDQGDALRELLDTFDGSAAATATLAQLTQARYQTELQLAQQLAESMASTHSSFESSIRSIQLAVMTDQQKYDFFDQEADTYRDVLATLTDPASITDYAGKLRESLMAGFNVLDTEQQKSEAPDFITLMQEADALAQERYAAAQQVIIDERHTANAELNAAIQSAVDAAMERAAAAIEARLSAPPPPVQIRFAANVPGDAEVQMVGA